jgi:hypothetical protein
MAVAVLAKAEAAEPIGCRCSSSSAALVQPEGWLRVDPDTDVVFLGL